MRNTVCAVLLIMVASFAAAQNTPTEPPDPYKPLLDRLPEGIGE